MKVFANPRVLRERTEPTEMPFSKHETSIPITGQGTRRPVIGPSHNWRLCLTVQLPESS